MDWFRIFLLVTMGLSAVTHLAKLGGWRPEWSPLDAAMSLVICVIAFVGVFVWL